MTIMHDVDLIQRLHLAENDLLTSLLDGTEMLSSYHQTWSALLDELLTASQNGNVGHETLSLAHLVASRISKIATCFLDIKRDEEISTAQLQRDCDALLHQMANLSINEHSFPDNAAGVPHSSGCSYPPTSDTEGSSSLVASAHRWLFDNLHNPYPSAEVKTRIATASSCQVSSVNSWFINARRRIGWTTLCRERFANCRADMIDAAYRALVEDDPQRKLSPELRHSFFAMKVEAEGLYSSTFTKSALAGDLDAIIEDITKERKESVVARNCRQVEQANLGRTVRDSYPSPDPSIAVSPVPVLDDSVTDQSEEEEDVAPPVIAGSKRRRPSMEPLNQLSSAATRPMKRLRASVSSSRHLPSPPSSTDGIDMPSDDSSPEPDSVRPIQSDANSSGIPKHPCNSMVTPRLHPASDPFTQFNMENESSIDDWFHTNFDALFAIPPPVDATEPDSSAPWEVELFKDYNIPQNPKCAATFPQTANNHASATTDFSDLDSLLQSIDNTFATASINSSIPDMSQPDVDWASLLNGPDTYQSIIHSTFPQYSTDMQPLPEIDLSMLQLPQAIPLVNPRDSLDFASKQAKLHQLHAMQEAVRRIEQELQSEGVII